MKILILNYEYPPIGGGGGVVSEQLAKQLALLGHSVTVLSMLYSGLMAHENSNGVNIYRVPCLRKKKSVCHAWEQLTYLFSALFFFIKELRHNKYDVCHCHFILPTGVLAFILKKIWGIPYVITAHGSDVPGHNTRRFIFLHKLLAFPWRKICRNAEYITAPSVWLKDLIFKSDPTLNCIIVPNSIDISLYHSSPKEKIIISLCRLQKSKNVHHVIEAFAQAVLPEWKLYIVGAGPELADLKKLAQEKQIMQDVVFTGWLEQNSEEKQNLLAKAHIFISASSFESFGISTLEALAAGCTVCISDIPGHQQYRELGANFFLVGDVVAMAKLLEFTSQKMAHIPENIKNYDINTASQSIENILKKACV